MEAPLSHKLLAAVVTKRLEQIADAAPRKLTNSKEPSGRRRPMLDSERWLEA
jgi:hypothetical protein